MSLTPTDIHHKEFRTSLRGYNEEEVDSFLDQVADELERLIHENVEMQQQLEQIKARVAEFEEMQTSLQSALLAATKSAEAVKDQARQESEAMVGKAQEEADSLVKSAQEQARQMILRAQNERQKLERSYASLRETRKRYIRALKEIAENHLAQVQELESKENEFSEVEVKAESDSFRATKVEEPPLVEEEVPADISVTEEQSVEVETKTAAEPEEAKRTQQDQPVEESQVQRKQQPPATEVKEEQGPPPAEAVSEPKRVSPGEVSDNRVREKRVEPEVRATPPIEKKEPRDQEVVPSSNLVDEVLAIEGEEQIYGDFENSEQETDEEVQGRKKSKRDKHFFWE